MTKAKKVAKKATKKVDGRSNREPSLRAKKAAKNMIENGGNKYKALIDAGYSEGYARNAYKFTNQSTTQDILDELMPRGLIVDTHVQLMKASKLEYQIFPVDTPEKEIDEIISAAGCKVQRKRKTKFAIHVWYYVPDNRARKDAIDMAYKLRGEFAPEKFEITDPIKQLSDEDLVREVRELTNFFRKK